MGALLPEAMGAGRYVQLLGQGETWQGEAEAASFGQGDRHILYEMVYLEPRLEVAPQGAGSIIG